MISKTRKIRIARKGPSDSASEFPEGTISLGNDKQNWVIKKVPGGSQRWVPYTTTELFGYKPLTVDYLAKHIGKTITVYEREYKDTWPKSFSKESTAYIHKFTPTGNALEGKKVLTGWLKTQSPKIKNNSMFFIEGEEDLPLQVDSKNKISVSNNIMNTEAFVKC
jgi:hypothetical protein